MSRRRFMVVDALLAAAAVLLVLWLVFYGVPAPQ
jgi:hypothetical protein